MWEILSDFRFSVTLGFLLGVAAATLIFRLFLVPRLETQEKLLREKYQENLKLKLVLEKARIEILKLSNPILSNQQEIVSDEPKNYLADNGFSNSPKKQTELQILLFPEGETAEEAA